jgi:light-regulated signal transduction histidine kinase (bacteriophytochrome)
VGNDSNYPPYEYLDKNGQPAGFNVDLTQAIARQLGLDVKIHLGSWDEIRESLGSGSIDAVQGMFYSAERDYLKRIREASTRMGQLIEILMLNLLENAVKYCANAASPLMEVGSVEQDGKNGRERAFWVRDNGVGFDMAFAGELFVSFQRLHSQKEYSGTGIGLVSVQRIVTRHGGRVWLEAETGKGAYFYFTLG